jgi:hypothetical protein
MFLQLLQKYQDKFRFKVAFIGKGTEVTIVVTPINKDDEDDTIPAFTAHGTLSEVEMALVDQFDDAMKGLRSAYASADEIRNKAKEVVADAEKKPGTTSTSKKSTSKTVKPKTDESKDEEDDAEDEKEEVKPEKVKEPAWTAAEKKIIKEIDDIVKKATEKKNDEMMVNFYRKAAVEKGAAITTAPYLATIEAKFAAIHVVPEPTPAATTGLFSSAPAEAAPTVAAPIATPAPAATTPAAPFKDSDLF